MWLSFNVSLTLIWLEIINEGYLPYHVQYLAFIKPKIVIKRIDECPWRWQFGFNSIFSILSLYTWRTRENVPEMLETFAGNTRGEPQFWVHILHANNKHCKQNCALCWSMFCALFSFIFIISLSLLITKEI